MEGDEDEGAEDQDHIMVFKTPGDELNKNSNDILSTGSFHAILFLSKALQLVLDFYFGFYLVHMSKRISLASDGSAGLQVLFHAGIMVPVLLTLYLLMLTTRKIALLFGVLHLNEDAVSDVLQHMELVKSIRRRIQDTLANTKVVHIRPGGGGGEAWGGTEGRGGDPYAARGEGEGQPAGPYRYEEDGHGP